MADVKTSTFLGLNWRDAGKAALIAGLTIFIATGGDAITSWLNEPTFHFDWSVLIVPIKNGLCTALAVIFQRLIEPNKVILTNVSKDLMNAIKNKTASVTIKRD